MDGKFVMGLPFRMRLLLSMMEEWMPSSNALSPEMLFPPARERLKWGFEVDDAIWAAENATLKAEMSGKKLMHSWNNLSSTLSFRRFKRGFGILQLGVHESLLAVKLD
ncbi:uncharacterized protein LOC125468218 isoform X2 [Pyrus x bretschneideri]|uniref:uncharacterized protein LOC125468218 isoform X2 n=1 Tax=Pyrus x bretschneideri TaxID=225117 RepID=UPI002030A09A|nr:uncharacterized protein LOC125468218 isoform X2 [Pyrus x bretschneideri]